MDSQTITNTFSEDFQQFHYTGKERENSYTNFFNPLLSCHQLELPEAMLNRGSWQILKPITWKGDIYSKISCSTINESALQNTVTPGTKQNKTNPAISALLSN